MSGTVNIGTLEGLLTWRVDKSNVDKSLDDIAKQANISRTTLSSYLKELAGIESTYKKVAASIDPTIAAEQKLEKAHKALSDAYKSGLIPSHEKYLELLDKAKQKYSENESPLKSLIEHVIKLTGSMGPAGAEAHEMAEGLGGLAGKVGSLGEMIKGLGPLLPIVAGLAAGLVAVGVAFAAFEFIKDAVEEGLKLQAVVERLNDSLKNTGSYSGLSSHEIIELAGSYALLTGRTKEEEIQAALVLTRFKNLTEDVYPKALDAVNAYARAQGITAAEAARKIGPLIDGNTRSLRAAKEIGVDLTTGQQAMLKSMVDTGDIAGYQAKIFDILTEKVGLAAGAHETLGIQAGRIKFVYGELKEGIASELIPALEYLSHDLFGSVDDWKQASKGASDFGHTIGDFLRTEVYGTIVVFHDLAASWDEVAIIIDKALISILEELGEFAQFMSKVPIMGAAWEPVKNGIGSALKTATDSLLTDTVALGKNQKASDDAIISWMAHKQALEGDTDVAKKHGSAQDEIGNKQKKLNDLVLESDKIIRAYTDKLADLTKKLVEEDVEQSHLLSAAEQGLDVYARELLTQERRKVVLAAVTQLEKEHRTEIEKLQDLERKGNDDKRAGDAAKIRAEIDASNASYQKQVKVVGDLAGKNFDLKHSTDLVLSTSKENSEFLNKQLELQAQLTDELTGTSVATRENAIQAEIKRKVLESLKHTQDDLTDSITEAVRREHDFTNSMKDALEAAKALGSLNNQASLQTAISRVDTGQSKYLQELETQYLEIIANIGHGSIEEGQRIIDETEKIFESLGINIGSISDAIKKDLQDLQDVQISKTISGASKTPFDLYKEERDRIEQYVSGSTGRTSQQVKDAQAYIEHLDSEYWANQASTWSSALNNIGSLFGGFLGKIANYLSKVIADVQSAYQTGQQVGGMLNNMGVGGAGLGGAMGGILAEVQIFYAVYSLVDQMIKDQEAHKFGTATQLTVSGGDWSSPSYFDQAGKKISDALRKMLQQITDAIGGILMDLPQITIRARNDGKKFGAYVAGVWVGEFDSAQEAMEAGIAAAITQANFAGVSKEIVQALQLSIGQTLDQIEQNIQTATQARNDRLGDAGAQYIGIVEKYNREIEAERRLGLSTDATVAARDRATQAEKNSALGIDTTASDRLAALKSLSDGIGEASDSITAALQKQIEDVQRQISQLETNPGWHGPNSGGGGGPDLRGGGQDGGFDLGDMVKTLSSDSDAALAHLRETLAHYIDELNKVPKALTDQEINMGIFDTLYQYLQASPKYAKEAAQWAKVKVQIEFDQIKLQLEMLGKWEEFAGMFNDALAAALAAAGKAPHAGGGKGSDKQSVQSFIDDKRFQMSLDGMDQFHQQLAQINHDYAAQLLAAGKDKKLREELLALQHQEIEAATKAHQKDVADRFNQLVNPNDAFEQARKPFEDMKKEIEGAGYGAVRTANMLGKLTAAEDKAIEKLSMQQFSSLVGDLSNVIADSNINAQQHLLHNELLQTQEVINFQIKMIELRDEYVLLKAKGDLTKDEIDLLDKAFGWLDSNKDILPGGKNWVPSFDSVTTAASSLSDAAANQNTAADSLKSAVQSLLDYQTSLHTDSSLGLVDARTALANSKADYEADRIKALTGDADAITKFRDFAETYRKNLVAFSPSSELTASVLSGIDDTINRIKLIPAVAHVLSPDTAAIVGGLSNISGIGSVSNHTLSAINDNLTTTTPNAIATAMDQIQQPQVDAALDAQNKNATALQDLSGAVKGLSDNILKFRTESRGNSDELFTQMKRAADALDTVVTNTRPRHRRAGVGG